MEEVMDFDQVNAEYLGDGVYAQFDGFHLWLFTHNGYEATNEIALDPETYSALVEYVEKKLKPANIAAQEAANAKG
jgi:hypothetical protein